VNKIFCGVFIVMVEISISKTPSLKIGEYYVK